MELDASVIVVSWNTRNLLRRCLESIRETSNGVHHEVIVVDNGSSDGSAEAVAAEFPEVRLIRNSVNRGFAGANNQAIAVARGRHLLLLNSDAILLPSALQEMVDFLDAHPDVGVVGVQLLNPDGSPQSSFADFPTFVSEILLLTKLSRAVGSPAKRSKTDCGRGEERTVDWVSGACLMARRSAVESVGPLDEDYFMYSEETDWCYRMWQAGWKVCHVPTISVVHWSGQSSNTAAVQKRSQLYVSKCTFMRKHRGYFTSRAFEVIVRFASALKLVLWMTKCVDTNSIRRQQAWQNVRSYRLLLSRL